MGGTPTSLRRLVKNPLIVKDGLSRVRTWRAPAVIALYLAVLGLVVYLALTFQLAVFRGGFGFAQVGKNVFIAIAQVQLALVCLFGPAVAAGAVSGERERQTLDVLMVSSMTPWAIIWGKLVASVAFILLLITAALPVFATVFFLGGIDFEQFLISQLVTVTTALSIGAVSLFLSVLFQRTLVSTVVAYGFTFAVTAGTWLVGTVLTQMALAQAQISRGPIGPTGPAGPPNTHPLLLISPFYGLSSALQNSSGARLGLQPANVLFSPGGPAAGVTTFEPWLATVLFQLALVGLGIFGAVWLLRGRKITLPQRSAAHSPALLPETEHP
jgi:ABC-type transport system involved in multi-copper enzyme maturation permease subunit